MKKNCACGRSISPISWDLLPFVGCVDNGRGIGEILELRNCSCGSTLAVPIGEHGPPSSESERDTWIDGLRGAPDSAPANDRGDGPETRRDTRGVDGERRRCAREPGSAER